jgi:hypothetical protein
MSTAIADARRNQSRSRFHHEPDENIAHTASSKRAYHRADQATKSNRRISGSRLTATAQK